METRWYGQAGDDPYAGLITSFIGREFPQLASGNTEDIMEAVVEAFLATKQYRIGPKPNPEALVMIRDVVRRAIVAKRPIPILIASAALKVPIGESLDLAELSALKVLNSLQQRVQQHYQPGVNIRIRLEDLTELAISAGEPELEEHLRQYMMTFRRLIQVLGYDFITPVAESELVDPNHFRWAVDDYAPVFQSYLAGNVTASAKLSAYKWAGGVSLAMREWMYDRYDRLYPGTAHGDTAQQATLSRYLAAILARRNNGGMGNDPTFNGRLELSFAPALPDAPIVSPRIYYRTVPLSQSSMHLPYWNAKGHLKINEAGETRIALGRWDDAYTCGQLEIKGPGGSVIIRADYQLEG